MDDTTKKELNELVKLGNKYLWSDSNIHKYLQDRGIMLEPARFYSTIPLIREIEDAFEYKEESPFALNGLFDEDKMKKTICKLKVYSSEFNPPLDGDHNNPQGFFWNNEMFSYSDAMSYYAMVRYISNLK